MPIKGQLILIRIKLYMQISALTRGIVASTYRENGRKCRYTIAKEPVDPFIPIVQLLRKNSPYTQIINQQLINKKFPSLF